MLVRRLQGGLQPISSTLLQGPTRPLHTLKGMHKQVLLAFWQHILMAWCRTWQAQPGFDSY